MTDTMTEAARPKSAVPGPKMQTTTNPVAVDITGMHKWYGDFHVLRDINLTVKRGERIVICGPSGSGKSTMIRCINRLEEHQQGRIVVDGTELTNDLKKIDETTSALDPEMVKEVLDTMVQLAMEGMTMMVVSHEMGFARQVANRVVFMDAGQIIEMNEPNEFFKNPQHERTKLFLSQILH